MRTQTVAITALLALNMGAACSKPIDTGADDGATGAGTGTVPTNCTPLAAGTANAPDQRPAFTGQTRACGVASNVAHDVTVVARGLEHPWAVEPLPGGDFLVTERPGRLRIVSAAGVVGEPIAGLPPVAAGGQGGLLDAALSPSFASDRTIFWSYSEPRSGGNGTSVARGVLSADRRRVEQVQVIFRALPTYANSMHFGSRLAFAPDGKLFVTTGERSDTPMRQHAQRLDGHLGKTMRINPDGSVPSDNPFAGRTDARGEIWSYGHRNVQAAAVDAQGRFWVIEHGTRGGDEVNLIQKGKNYGWPIQAYGEEYSGQPIASATTQREGTEQPVYYWDPVIAPSGAQWYTGDAFPAWKGSLFVGALGQQRLVRLEVRDDRVTGEEHLLTDRRQRIRDVRQGPDGFLYLVTDSPTGELLRVSPRR
ncbi:MAG TPA: PQQ-dependent sugar dehydrogenase, partial [Gemmatimonadaceae bacterium]|nr:PQQ-dependent sugar dehydrogenase [Gemmatimonadaceae bacterium]